MRNYVTFLKKEWLESLRTYKLFVMLASFSILGIMNPLIAKLTPEIIDPGNAGGNGDCGRRADCL